MDDDLRTILVPRIVGLGQANNCSNSHHCYNPMMNVTRTHKAECYALFYGCERECRSECHPKVYFATAEPT